MGSGDANEERAGRPGRIGGTVFSFLHFAMRALLGALVRGRRGLRVVRLAIRDDGGGWRRLRVPRAGAVPVTFP